MRQRWIALLLALPLAGCALPGLFQTGSPDGGWGGKTVADKEAPATLLAGDGTKCTVTAAKFARTKRGDRVWCYWWPYGGTGVGTGPGPPGQLPSTARTELLSNAP